MYAAHYLLGVLAAALIGFALGVVTRGIASHVLRPRAPAPAEKASQRGGFVLNLALALGAALALVGLWLFAQTDLETWGQPVLGAGAVVGAALGWWAGPGVRDAFITRRSYRPPRRRRHDAADEPAGPFASLEDDPAPPPSA
jgi:hypothetical protein